MKENPKSLAWYTPVGSEKKPGVGRGRKVSSKHASGSVLVSHPPKGHRAQGSV